MKKPQKRKIELMVACDTEAVFESGGAWRNRTAE